MNIIIEIIINTTNKEIANCEFPEARPDPITFKTMKPGSLPIVDITIRFFIFIFVSPAIYR